MAIQCASDALKSDKDIVMAAVRQNGLALQYAADDLKTDEDVVTASMKQDKTVKERLSALTGKKIRMILRSGAWRSIAAS